MYKQKWLANVNNPYLITIIAVCGQDCTGTVGSLSHDNTIITLDQTFILAGYRVPCNRIVVAWEFCYQVVGAPSVTFSPGIWRINGTMGGNTNYELVQSNSVTYNSSIRNTGIDSCQKIDLSTTDRFNAPAGSVVGLYSNVQTQLLHTNTNSSITTYQFSGNQSSVHTTGINSVVNFNIAIRVHLGKLITDGILKYSTTVDGIHVCSIYVCVL